MQIKRKLAGLILASFIAIGAAGPLAAMADGNNPSQMQTGGGVTLTAQQATVIQSLSTIIGEVTAQVQVMAAARTAESQLFAQWIAQLNAMQVQLAQGGITTADIANMQSAVAGMTAQASQIAARRIQENNLLAMLPGLLQQALNWLATLQ